LRGIPDASKPAILAIAERIKKPKASLPWAESTVGGGGDNRGLRAAISARQDSSLATDLLHCNIFM
jgi:hypothetical protein